MLHLPISRDMFMAYQAQYTILTSSIYYFEPLNIVYCAK